MTEKREQLDNILKLVVIAVCASLYAWGGIEHKELRRFVAPIICGISMTYFMRDWRALIVSPLLIASSCLGYGANEFWVKILKRSYVGLAVGLSASSYNIIRREWMVVGFTIIVLTAAYIVFGVFNPLNARAEETLLGLLNYGLCIMGSKRRE